MTEKSVMVSNVLLTFFIGFVAGIAPFLFMELLPNLLNKGVTPHSPNYLAISVTGILIGLITSILFAKNFKEKEPRDIFFYALGIPAILIATVTNMNTDFSARKVVDEARANASMNVLKNNSEPVIEKFKPVEVTITGDKISQSSWLELFSLTRTAYAEEKPKPSKEKERVSQNYVVSVGEYADKDTAVEAYKALLSNKLASEKYISKKPKLLQTETNSYTLSYSDYADKDEAIKAYKLLKINDPEYSIHILKGE